MSLLSYEFLALALVATTILPLTRGVVRWWLFFSLNAVFMASFLRPVGMVSTGLLCAAGYLIARWAQGGAPRAVVVGTTALTVAFAYMRGYDLVDWVLPANWQSNSLATVGLSFLFFKIVHVVIDSGAGRLDDLSLPKYINYCTNFTTFLLGPIQRFQDFSAQWDGRTRSIEAGFEAHLDAVNRVLRGLVKKFVLAEFLVAWSINPGMNVQDYSAGALLLRTYVFYVYLYCDFSGYCDIVIGVGSLMGIRPPENFDLPFLARNVGDYWMRVHRSLTTWLTDYVFNPCLSASMRRHGKSFQGLALTLIVTMTISGLWHGTTVSFLLFGIVHGVLLVVWRGYEWLLVERWGRQRAVAFSRRPVVHLLAVFVTYNVTSLAYVFFVFDIDTVWRYLRRLAGA